MFKKRRGIHLPYNVQGLIYFTCVNIKRQPQEVQACVWNLCALVGGEDADALYEFLTDDRMSAEAVCMKYYISGKKLYRMRKKFYEEFAKCS